MNTASIGQQDRSAISDLLEEVASLTELGSEVGAAATYRAQAVWSGLGEDELQTVAWLLRDGDRHSRLPAADGEPCPALGRLAGGCRRGGGGAVGSAGDLPPAATMATGAPWLTRALSI